MRVSRCSRVSRWLNPIIVYAMVGTAKASDIIDCDCARHSRTAKAIAVCDLTRTIRLHKDYQVAYNWLITGTSSGFGRLLTELALERGDNVVATVRKPSALDDLKEKYASRLRVAILDVTDAREISSVVNQAFDALGSIDFAVSNAGYIYGWRGRRSGAAENSTSP